MILRICLLAQLACFNKAYGVVNDGGPKNLFESPCEENVAIKATKGRVERRGKDLFLWLPGYFQMESGLVFRNPSGDNKTTFKYCGGTETFDLVLEEFDHDAPMLYIVEKNGKKNWYHLGDDAVYVTPDSQSLLSTRNQQDKNSNINSISIKIVTARAEKHGSYDQPTFQESFECKIDGGQNFSLMVSKLTNSNAAIEAIASGASQFGDKSKAALGKIHLNRKDGKWHMTVHDGVFESASCISL